MFAVFFAPFTEKGILDYIAHRSIIQVFTVGALLHYLVSYCITWCHGLFKLTFGVENIRCGGNDQCEGFTQRSGTA